ncbi:MAG TPA: sulfurtransferase [Gammaproteobacteria bacterium]|nr:sulfurtransferase [Gammaproteobacteria bacterium]
MSNTLARLSCCGLLLAALVMPQNRIEAQPDKRGGALVTAQWLATRVDDPSVRIIDLGKTLEQFETGHIPGAVFVEWRADLADPARAPFFDAAPKSSVEALLSRLGVEPNDTIVLYDSQSSRLAARMFWLLRYYGHRDLRILDGGADGWEAAGFAQSVSLPTIEATDYRFDAMRSELRADLGTVTDALRRTNVVLVDARAPEFFTGEATGSQFQSDRPNAKVGRIPGARNMFWADHFNADGTFRSITELAARYAAAGIGPEQTVISYCHVGLQASTPWFVLSELLGYPDVRLYDSSMAEWANTDGTPLETGSD